VFRQNPFLTSLRPYISTSSCARSEIHRVRVN